MWIKILLLFFVFSFLFRTDLSFDQDLGRHLKLGEIILQTNHVPNTNLFSYTNPDFLFINTHWLFEVLVYVVNQTIGLQWMLILKIAVILLSVWLVIKTIPYKNWALLLPVGFIFLHVLRERIELRPEIFSFLFTALTLFILELSSSMKRNNLLFILPLIQLTWINTHIYFFVGLLLQAIFIIHTLGVKLTHPKGVHDRHLGILLIVLAFSILVSLINPNGIKGVLYPLNVTTNYGYTIVENQTMFFLESIDFKDPNFLFAKLSVGLIVLSLILAFYNRRLEIKNILLPVFGMTLALINVRGFPYLVLISLPATLANFPSFKFKGFIKILSILIVSVLILESYFYLNGDYYRFRDLPDKPGLAFTESTKGALDFVISKDLPQPIFNNFDIGSYVLYRGYPKYRVFVDGRPEAYPAQFFTGVYIPSQSDYKNFKEVERLYRFKTIIFSHTDQTPWGRNFLQNVVKDEGWKLVYIDDFMVVLTTQDVVNQKKLLVIDLAKLTAESYRFNNHVSYLRLGLFLLSTGRGTTQQNIESGRKFIGKTLQLFPDSPIANQLVGNSQKSKSKFFW